MFIDGKFLASSDQISRGASDTGANNFSYEPQIEAARERSPGFDELNSEIEQARLQSLALDKSRTAIKEKIAKKDKKKDKKKKKHITFSSDSESGQNKTLNMSEVEAAEHNGASGIPSEMLPSQDSVEELEREHAAEEERRRNREPVVTFKNIDVCYC